MLTILRGNRNFRCLWLSQFISGLGDRLTQMGILTFIMVASGDNGNKMALITFFSLMPFSLFGPLCGAFADRFSRKNIMLSSDAVRAILVALIPLVWLSTHSLGLMLGWFFLLGSFASLALPARMAIITDITEKDSFIQANSIISATAMAVTLIGTFIAGLVIKATGIKPAFYLNCLTYIISALFTLNIIYRKKTDCPLQAEASYARLFNDIRVGIRYTFRHRLLVSLIVLSSVFAFVSSFAYILILNYGSTLLRLDSFGIGCLLSSSGLGMLAGCAILMKRKEKVNYKRALYLSYLVIGIFSFGFVFRPEFIFTLVILFCAGIGASIFTIAQDTVFQRVSPDRLRGKIFAARGVLTNSIFLACLLLVGWLVKYILATKIFAFVGVVSLFTSVCIFLYQRRWGYELFRLFLRFLLFMLFDFKVSGAENLPKARKVILAGNHTSVIDGVSLMCAYPGRVYFLAAESLFKAGFWGWCARHLGYIPIKRGGFNKEAIRKALDILESGGSIGIFPEGRITEDGRLTEGREGVAVIAQLAKVDIVPFAIEGAYEAWPLPKKYPKRFPIEVRFAKPVQSEKFFGHEELTQEIMQEIAEVKLSLERDGYLRVEPDEIIRHLINIG